MVRGAYESVDEKTSVSNEMYNKNAADLCLLYNLSGTAVSVPPRMFASRVPCEISYPIVWSKEDDTLVRKTASRVEGKKWELVKLCINVIDENCEIMKEMKLKENIRERISWSEADEETLRI